LSPLHATRGAGAAIVDAAGRQVTLRGVNVNSLGDYYQADPHLPTVVPVRRADWARMAAHGFNVVRLLVSWSSLEPRPGHIDRRYLRRVHRTVDTAARYGIYSVVDMHQDAWGKYIASPPGTVCPAGSAPAIGWDGAPKWATITDGASTCVRGSREDSDAVLTAWDSFYADRNGIMTHLVNVWTAVAREFRHDTAVAGFDLINEPNLGRDPNVLVDLATYFKRALGAIRAGEAGGRSLHHIVFFETTVVGGAVEPFSDDPNLVFEGHNYGESIGSIPLEAIFDYFQSLATKYGTALWIGEYGWFSDPGTNEERLGRFAAKEDTLLTAGDAWWQWRQACGDPHSVGHPGGTPDAVLVHFQRNGCPGDHNLGVVPQWACTWRPYPRAAPGRLTERRAECTRDATVAGTTTRPGTLELWYPGSVRPAVTGSGISHVRAERVRGGWSVTARVQGSYRLRANTPP
jgi:endoglycosylceramidase